MALPNKRILSRNLRLGLQQVYGQNPFDVMRNTNTSLEAVTDKVKDARVSLGKVKNLINLLKGLQGKFDTSGLKNDFLDMLGINVFKRNLNNLKAELTGLANDLGIRTRSSIDRLNGLSEYSKNQVSAALHSGYGIHGQGYDKLDPVTAITTPSTTTPLSPSTQPLDTVPVTPAPSVTNGSTQCAVPMFASSSTVTGALGIANVPVQSAIIIKPTAIPPAPTVTVSPQPVTLVDPIQTLITIALIAAAIQEYGSLDNLPEELKPLIAELLVAIGLDLSNEQVLLAGLQLGSIPILVELFPNLIDSALAIITDIPALIAAMDGTPVSMVFPTIKPNKPQLVQIQQSLPPMGSIDPTPLTTPAQIATVVAVPTEVRSRARYIRQNYMHQYYPTLSI